MSKYEADYFQLLNEVASSGDYRDSRAGPTIGKFGMMFKVDSLREGKFPILTTRTMYPLGIFGELGAFLEGSEMLADFKAHGCNYWDMNAQQWHVNNGLAPDDMQVGRIYGVQWREWNGYHDQLGDLVEGIRNNPYGRRHLVTAWNPSELDQMCLPPCHYAFQAYVTTDGYLDLVVNMRSVDLCLGLPADVVLYAAFLILLAKQTGYKPGTLTWMLGDAHIYQNHRATLVEQRRREPYALPTWECTNEDITRFLNNEIVLKDYVSHEGLKYALN